MSTVVLMRLLESAPDRYDAGMRWLSLGAVPRLHDAVAAAATKQPHARVLEIGCGTGAVTARLVARGADVVAIDQDPEMLARARSRLRDVPAARVELREAAAAEIDGLPDASFDAVVASLCLSEMSAAERTYVLRQAARVLRPGGRLVVGDEVRPRRVWQRLLHALLRYPLVLLTWAIAGTTSRAIPDPAAEIHAAGFKLVEEHRSALGTLAVIVAEKTQ